MKAKARPFSFQARPHIGPLVWRTLLIYKAVANSPLLQCLFVFPLWVPDGHYKVWTLLPSLPFLIARVLDT